MAGAPFGFGMVLIFLGIMNYLIDAYTIFAASVLAANSVLRSLFGAAFPLFTSQMYANLGIHWASSIPAFLALMCVPFPFLFYKYGAKIRVNCKYAAQSEKFMKEMAGQNQDSSDDDEDEKPEKEIDDTETATDTDVEKAEPRNRRGEAVEEEEELPRRESVISSSTSDDGQPTFAPITTTKSRAERIQAGYYDHSPFDLDRVNTRESFKRTGSNSVSRVTSRATSVSSKTSRR